MVFLIGLASSLHSQHARWSTQQQQLAKITDINWNYCDLKCLYLQNYLKDADFVVINFQKVPTGETYADCYVKNSNGTFDYWSLRLKNAMYRNICNDDPNINMLDSKKYKVVSVQGEGIGTEIDF